MTSATRAIDGSSRIAAKSVVSDARSAGSARSLAGSRTSARTTPEPVAGRALDVVGVLVEQPVDGRADGAVAQQGYGNVNCRRHAASAPGALASRERAQLAADRLDLGGARPAPGAVRLGAPAPSRRSTRARRSRRGCPASSWRMFVAHVLVDHDAGPRVAPYSAVSEIESRMSAEAALVDQVDDQLHLVHALVVGDLGLVAGLDERLEAELDQPRDAAAEHGLLAEEVALGLLRERRLDHPGAAAPIAVP